MMPRRLSLALLMLACPTTLTAMTLHVPVDYLTIQGAIAAAVDGDIILVSPGTYAERIDFLGKLVTVTSTDGPLVTIIDGQAAGSVVTFQGGEGRDAVLDGFTVRNGRSLVGGGIYVLASSPTIAHCRIIQNVAVPVGSDNGFGGGVLLVNSNAVIHDSEIAYNSCPAGDAGGLGTTGSANFIILERNVIRNNTALGNGGGLHLRNADATLTNDTVAFNASGTGTGGGVYLYREGAAWKTVDLDNCIIWGNTAGGAGPNIYNDAVSVLLGVTYSDVTGGWGGLGNIAADPLFVDAAAGELHLQAASPCIDTGDPHSPPDPDGSVADMGALPSLSAFVSLGGSLAGSAGAPELTGEGSLVASTPVVLALTKAKPFALSTLVVGVSDLSAAFKGGILVPNTDLLFLLTTDFFGGSTFGGLWPAGVPSSFTTYFQWWVQDQGRPKGFTASNALAGTTP